MQNGKEITMSLTDLHGKSIIQFLHFREVDSPFGFLQLVQAEKNGVDISKRNFQLQKNNLLHKWSQIEFILSVMNTHEPSSKDVLMKIIKDLEKIGDLQDNPSL